MQLRVIGAPEREGHTRLRASKMMSGFFRRSSPRFLDMRSLMLHSLTSFCAERAMLSFAGLRRTSSHMFIASHRDGAGCGVSSRFKSKGGQI